MIVVVVCVCVWWGEGGWRSVPLVVEIATNCFSILILLSQLLMSTRSPLAELNVLKKICDHPRLLSTLACEQLGLDEEDRFVTAFQQLNRNASMTKDQTWFFKPVGNKYRSVARTIPDVRTVFQITHTPSPKSRWWFCFKNIWKKLKLSYIRHCRNEETGPS